jgi:hypothetical protein
VPDDWTELEDEHLSTGTPELDGVHARQLGCHLQPTDRALPTKYRLAIRLTAAVIGLALLPTGCGGSSNPSSGLLAEHVPAKFRQLVHRTLAYSSCMRTHGVLSFADPKISVSSTRLIMQNPQMTPTEVASPAYQSATTICAKYLRHQPQGPASTGGSNTEARAVRFASCTRAHGRPPLPRPDAWRLVQTRAANQPPSTGVHGRDGCMPQAPPSGAPAQLLSDARRVRSKSHGRRPDHAPAQARGCGLPGEREDRHGVASRTTVALTTQSRAALDAYTRALRDPLGEL